MQRIAIPSYDNNTVKNRENFERLVVLKREKRCQEALILLDAIDAIGAEDPNELRRFVTYLQTNKERSIVYRKLKNKPLTEYYYILYELGCMINATLDATNIKNIQFYFENELSDNDKVKQRVHEYIEWFKPLAYELLSINKEIKKEIDDFTWERNDHYLDYQYQSSRDLGTYMRKKNKRLPDVLQKIECNMPHHFIDKSLFLQ
jgi:hypothetical protein